MRDMADTLTEKRKYQSIVRQHSSTTKKSDAFVSESFEEKIIPVSAIEEKLENRERENEKYAMHRLLFILLVLSVGIGVSYLICVLNRTSFGIFVWPVAACVAEFVFSTAGFFLTEGKTEILYGGCSIASVACFIVQLALLF
jgi:hypothetical protein